MVHGQGHTIVERKSAFTTPALDRAARQVADADLRYREMGCPASIENGVRTAIKPYIIFLLPEYYANTGCAWRVYQRILTGQSSLKNTILKRKNTTDESGSEAILAPLLSTVVDADAETPRIVVVRFALFIGSKKQKDAQPFAML